MELISVDHRDKLPPIDKEILNEKHHEDSVEQCFSKYDTVQEFLALGMNKGSILMLHVRNLKQLYCRFTIHREEVRMVKYLPHSDTFVSSSSENDLVFWKLDKKERKVTVENTLMIGRSIVDFHVMEDKVEWPSQSSISAPSFQPKDRIWMCFEYGDQEVFEYENGTLYLIESEKQKEHEKSITGFDYNRKLGLVVSSCEAGQIKVWSVDKAFIREIQLPHKVESVCFHNQSGDILVSHEKNVSQIKF